VAAGEQVAGSALLRFLLHHQSITIISTDQSLPFKLIKTPH
jgi:hypothetical protein